MVAIPSNEQLEGLLERVKAATGPDRGLDAAIGKELGSAFRTRNVYRRGHYIGGNPVLLRVAEDYPPITASIDAALALVERQVGHLWYSILLDALREFGVAGTLGPEKLPRFVLLKFLQHLVGVQK